MLPLLVLVSLQQTAPESRPLPSVQVELQDVLKAPRPNILLIVADDYGVDLAASYQEGSAPACTPFIDSLAAEGLLFRNAWANPTCSPTRAALLTGRYGFRTGVGDVQLQADAGLLLSETTLPEMLVGYSTAALGKWHLAGNQGNLHPNASGFGHYAGSIGGGVPNYMQWPKITDGQFSMSTTYATVDVADEALEAMQTLPEPWFLYVSFNAPHTPLHQPPRTACSPPMCPTSFCGNLPPSPGAPALVKAMSEAMDHEIGRILALLELQDPNALVVFVGDNGTDPRAVESPFLSDRAKGTVYEGGVNVPLIIRGPGVAVGECQALVSVVDFFATFAELAGVPSLAEDSVSLVSYFDDPSLALRETVFSERFSSSGGPPFTDHQRAIRDERYKLIRRSGQPDELYDLVVDPFESSNLLPNLSAIEQQAYDALVTELVVLGVD